MLRNIQSLSMLLWIFVTSICRAEITIVNSVQTIYDKTPKLRIKGSGFDADEHSIILDISANNQPSLKVDKDFLIAKYDDGLVLKLFSNQRYN